MEGRGREVYKKKKTKNKKKYLSGRKTTYHVKGGKDSPGRNQNLF